MAKARRRDRVTAWFFAIIFILSSSALTVAIVLDNLQKDNNDASTSQPAEQNAAGGNMLQGTQLQDFTPVSSVPELQKIDTKIGDGAEVKVGDTITVDYTGAVAATGKIFQSSKDTGQPATFELIKGGLIEGWVEGLPGTKAGGTRRLVIPYAQAYGEAGRPDAGIPARADLVFDITVQSIGQ